MQFYIGSWQVVLYPTRNRHLIRLFAKSVYSNDFLIFVFTDMKNAVDCVSTNILWAKLQAYGVGGDYIKWFRSYLTDHAQCVNFILIVFVNAMLNVSNVLLNVLYKDDTYFKCQWHQCPLSLVKLWISSLVKMAKRLTSSSLMPWQHLHPCFYSAEKTIKILVNCCLPS